MLHPKDAAGISRLYEAQLEMSRQARLDWASAVLDTHKSPSSPPRMLPRRASPPEKYSYHPPPPSSTFDLFTTSLETPERFKLAIGSEGSSKYSNYQRIVDRFPSPSLREGARRRGVGERVLSDTPPRDLQVSGAARGGRRASLRGGRETQTPLNRNQRGLAQFPKNERRIDLFTNELTAESPVTHKGSLGGSRIALPAELVEAEPRLNVKLSALHKTETVASLPLHTMNRLAEISLNALPVTLEMKSNNDSQQFFENLEHVKKDIEKTTKSTASKQMADYKNLMKKVSEIKMSMKEAATAKAKEADRLRDEIQETVRQEKLRKQREEEERRQAEYRRLEEERRQKLKAEAEIRAEKLRQAEEKKRAEEEAELQRRRQRELEDEKRRKENEEAALTLKKQEEERACLKEMELQAKEKAAQAAASKADENTLKVPPDFMASDVWTSKLILRNEAYPPNAIELIRQMNAFEESNDFKHLNSTNDPQVKDIRLKVKKRVNTLFNQLASTEQQVMKNCQMLISFLQEVQRLPAKIYFHYTIYFTCERLLRQCDVGSQIYIKPSSSWAFAHVFKGLKFDFPVIEEILRGLMYKNCCYAAPILYRKLKGMAAETFHSIRGQQKDETEETFFQRMAAHLQVWLAFLLIMDKYEEIFSWFRSFLSLSADKPRRITASLLVTALRTTGYGLQGFNKSKFHSEIMCVIQQQFLSKLKQLQEHNPAAISAPTSQLCVLLNDYRMKGIIPEPEGKRMKTRQTEASANA